MNIENINLSDDAWLMLRTGYAIDLMSKENPSLDSNRIAVHNWAAIKEYHIIRELYNSGLSDSNGKLTNQGFKLLCQIKS